MAVAAIDQLKVMAGVLSHIGDITAIVDRTDSSQVMIGDSSVDGVIDVIDVETFRAAVVTAAHQGSLEPLDAALGGLALPVSVTVVAGPGIRSLDRGTRWRQVCECGTTDFTVMRLDVDDALSLAESALDAVLLEPCLSLWARPDPELGVTVVACEWLGAVPPEDDLRIDQAFRDLVVMDRVGAEIRVP